MNRIYKIIWNEALGCFTAVGEYAKGRGKSSKSSVGSSTTINTISHLSSINTLRLSAIVLGLLAAGFGMQANATGTENHHDGDYSHSHGSHGVHYHTTGNNSHNNNSNPDDSEGSISLKFEGDNATTITRTNGETLNILGGATGTLTNGNIGVFGIGDTLTIQLAENIDLGADGSLKTGDTLVDSSGIKITTSNPINNVLLGHSGLNNGNNIITGVAPGAINATSTDAVNGSQLHATNTAVNTNSTAISSGLNFDGDTGDTVNRQLGQTLTVKGGATNLSDNNIGVEANGSNALTVKLAKDLTGLTSVTTGDTLLNTDGVRFLGGSTVRLSSQGLDNGGNQITNVASGGTTTTNAANIEDVRLASAAARTQVVKGTNVARVDFSTDSLTGQDVYTVNADGVTVSKGSDAVIVTAGAKDATNTTDYQVDLSDDSKASLVKADSAMQTVVTQIDGADVKTLNKTDNTANFLSGNNIVLSADGEGIKVSTADNVVFTSVTTGDTLLNTDGVRFLGGSTVRLSSQGLDNGGNQITNVASGGTTTTNAANIEDVRLASAAARTQVVKGTNVARVDFSTDSLTGQDVYTVNADGVTVSKGSDAVIVTAGAKDATNTTDYQVDLSDDSKASLVKADSAMQTVVTQIDGADVKTLNKTDNTANFLSGNNIVLSADGEGIKVSTADNVVFTSVTTGDTLLNTDGVRFLGGSTVRLSSQGLDNGGNQITNVGDGAADMDAVNVRQLKATNSTVDLGLDFTGDDTTVVVNRQLGETLTIKGGAADLTENNIGVVADDKGNLNVRLAKDVMLGSTGSVRMESTVLNNAGITITDGPNETITLSNEGLDNGNNRIIKVAKGIAPSDAVNFAQLTTTNNEIAKGINIGDGNSANDQQFALGDTINITGDSNLTTTASATGLQVKLNNQLDLGDSGRMQIGNSIMNNTGFTFVDNGMGRTVRMSSTGLDNGGNPIRNVGKGTLNTDAVNLEQLREVTIALDQGWGITAQGDIATMVKQGGTVDMNSRDGNITVSRTLVNNPAAIGLRTAAISASANDISFDLNPNINVVSITAGDTFINDNGLTIVNGPSITKNGIDAADNKITNVQNGEVTANSQEAINGSQLYAQGSGIGRIIGGNTVYNPVNGTFINSNIGGTGRDNIDGAIASIRQGAVEINENVQVNTTNIATNTTNIATNTTNIATNTANIVTNTTNIKANQDRLNAGLNFGADHGTTIKKSVGDGSVLTFKGGNNVTTTAEGSSIKFDLNGNINLDSVTTGNTTINSNGVTMVGGPSMTASGINAAGNKITNVADGMAPRDAVNFGQLDAVSKRLGDSMNELGYKIGEVEDDANAGISAAMAMSSLPQAYIVGKSMIGGGVGTYNGESAVAIGFSKLSNDGRWVMKLNGTADTQGNAGASIGAGFHFD